MNREIKFRIWDTVNKEYINPEGYYFTVDFKQFIAFDRYFDVDEENFIIQQYTGLKDKRGKEIYEGDIINTSNGIKEVIYSEDIASFECTDWLGSRNLYGYQKENDIQIIGNIFENQELIKNKR